MYDETDFSTWIKPPTCLTCDGIELIPTNKRPTDPPGVKLQCPACARTYYHWVESGAAS